jgi:hypothetical protein
MLNKPLDIWVNLAREKYPTLTESQLSDLWIEAASRWYSGEESELTLLFDQFVMLKTLSSVDKRL